MGKALLAGAVRDRGHEFARLLRDRGPRPERR